MRRSSFAFAALALAVAFLTPSALLAQTGAKAEPTPTKYLEMLRKDVQADKVAIMTEALDLTEAQAAAFWPIYREYATELAALGDRRIALIKKFAASYGSTTNEQAAAIAKDAFAIQEARLSLLKKTHGRVEKATTSLIAAQFVQVENVLGMLIDLQIAAEIPLME